jgi:hypothetical protein
MDALHVGVDREILLLTRCVSAVAPNARYT